MDIEEIEGSYIFIVVVVVCLFVLKHLEFKAQNIISRALFSEMRLCASLIEDRYIFLDATL